MNWFAKKWFQKQQKQAIASESVVNQLSTGNNRTVASLTFNDGPTPYGTPALLRILDQFQVKATFFLLGENVVRHPKLVTEILDAGHTIGNHSYSHLDPWDSSLKSTLRDIQKSVEVIEQLTSQSVDWYRPPFGHVTNHQVTYAERYGLKTVLGKMIVPDDQKTSNPEKLATRILTDIEECSIINFHDNSMSSQVTPKILCNIFPKLIATGWKFETLKAA